MTDSHQFLIRTPDLPSYREVRKLIAIWSDATSKSAVIDMVSAIGRFAKGCIEAALYPGAAPITLIDGDKLMELLLKHGVGVKTRPQTLIEIDDSYFADIDVAAETAAGVENPG